MRGQCQNSWSVVANKAYIEQLRGAIWDLHTCDSRHVESISVHEAFRGKTVWKGAVEVFDLLGHPKAKRCFAWSHRSGPQDETEQFVTVLELPPVDSARAAVRAAIVSQARKK
jgi:hypothetical protein